MTTTNEVNRVGRDAEGQDEQRVCAPEFWVPKSHLKSWFTGFGWFLAVAFAVICVIVGAYHVVGSVKDFLGGLQ